MSFNAQNNNNNNNRRNNNNNRITRNNNPVQSAARWVARGSTATNTVSAAPAPLTTVTTTLVTPGFGVNGSSSTGNGRDDVPVNRNQNQTYVEPKYNRVNQRRETVNGSSSAGNGGGQDNESPVHRNHKYAEPKHNRAMYTSQRRERVNGSSSAVNGREDKDNVSVAPANRNQTYAEPKYNRATYTNQRREGVNGSSSAVNGREDKDNVSVAPANRNQTYAEPKYNRATYTNQRREGVNGSSSAVNGREDKDNVSVAPANRNQTYAEPKFNRETYTNQRREGVNGSSSAVNGREDKDNVSVAPANRNQTYAEPKFNRATYTNQRGERGRGSENHNQSHGYQENRVERPANGRINQGEHKQLKDPNLPQLVQEIQEKLSKGNIECMICYDMVGRSARIWSCSSCYSIFHLNCIKKWARAPTSVDTSAEKNQGLNWRCPGCQSVQLTSSRDIPYLCFCGKRQEPPSDLYLTPHSCGEPCGKKLEKELPGHDGLSEEDLCPHVCVLQCHPGPCPPCKAFAPARSCPCGKEVITTRCSDRKSVLTCGQQCGKLLDCGRHRCEQTCHVGPCGHCQIVVNAYCFCKKKTEAVLCGDMGVKGDIKMEDGVFSCNSACGKKLSCGNHVCHELCHPGPCGDCALLPSKVKTCCCGKTSLEEERHSCLDPIPTCSKVCGKSLRCGVHRCEAVCHSGDCTPCLVPVTQRCCCGSTSRTVECYRTQSEDEKFTCDRPCQQKKNCGRHRCSERCCPLSNPKNSVTGDWNPHFCSMPCEKKLRCGQHSCESLCHIGHCPPCLETIFADLTCACGRTSIPPPLPCGTPTPACQLPCSVPQPCGHPATHSCHFGDCLPCAVPVAKECVGGHVILRNIPCGSKDIRCNKLCGKTRQCGLHACARTCHPSPCDVSAGPSNGSRASCGQTCGAPRRDCRHTCTALCHPSSSCPDVRCEFPVTITCSCGRITANVPCDAGGQSVDSLFEASIIQKLPSPLQPIETNGKKVPLGQRKLTCDDECAKMEKKKVLSDAFGISPPNLEALHFGENAAVSEVLGDLLRRDPKWVLSIEERCKFLVLGRSRGGVNALKVHVFCPMLKEKRDAIRLIAARWKLSVNAAGWEPKRFIVIHVTPKSKAPARILGAKGCTVNNIAQPAAFDSLVDMDPRLVVALFDLPRDADISALVLRFGGECELAWLNDKNALAVFSDPARAATAMRRLDQGSAYCGAALVPHSGVASAVTSSTANAWGVSGGAKDLKGNPWKKAVVQEPHLRESPWDAEEWSKNPTDSATPSAWRANEAPPTASSNRWSVLEPEVTSSLPRASITIKEPVTEPEVGGSVFPPKPGVDDMADVVDDWDKAYD